MKWLRREACPFRRTSLFSVAHRRLPAEQEASRSKILRTDRSTIELGQLTGVMKSAIFNTAG